MTEFFPGSRQVVTPPAGLPDPLGGLTGKTFTIRGVEVELFTIGQVADALNRTPVAIRKWEANRVIPKATFSKPGVNQDPRGRRRLYSRPQVEALVRIAQEEGILHDKYRSITKTQFKAKVLHAFREIASQT